MKSHQISALRTALSNMARESLTSTARGLSLSRLWRRPIHQIRHLLRCLLLHLQPVARQLGMRLETPLPAA